MSPVPLCLEKWGVMTPQLLWERRPCVSRRPYNVVLFGDRPTPTYGWWRNELESRNENGFSLPATALSSPPLLLLCLLPLQSRFLAFQRSLGVTRGCRRFCGILTPNLCIKSTKSWGLLSNLIMCKCFLHGHPPQHLYDVTLSLDAPSDGVMATKISIKWKQRSLP